MFQVRLFKYKHNEEDKKMESKFIKCSNCDRKSGRPGLEQVYYKSKQEQHLKYRLHSLMCNTTKTKLRCLGHIYNHSFDDIECYTVSYIC